MENISLLRKEDWRVSVNERVCGDEVCYSVTNNTAEDVRIQDVYVYSESHGFVADAKVVAEGYTMLSQYAGTVGEIKCFASLTDKGHYKLRQVDGFSTVYNYIIIENSGKWDLYSFTSCKRFNGRILINASELVLVVDMENTVVKAGETVEIESVYISRAKSFTQNIADMGELIGKNHEIRLTQKLPTGWCSWYCFGPGLTVNDVERNLDVMNESLPQFEYVQIDDGYQANMGDWLDCADYFGDVREVIGVIRDKGFEPAIWVAPFIAEANSAVFKEHPEYFIKDKRTGLPLSSAEFTFAGWRRGPWYMIDGTNPAAQAHLTNVFRTMREEWKVKYFKLDANVWGALTCDNAVRYDENSTTVDAYRQGMEAVWKGAGADAVVLGCNAPMWSSIGAVNAMRISGDLSRDFGTLKMLRKEIFNRNWMHNVLWTNDPDVFTVQNQYNEQLMPDGSIKRSDSSNLTEDELEYQRAMMFASAGMILSGDDMTHYTKKELDAIKLFDIIADNDSPSERAATFDEEEAIKTGDRFAAASLTRNNKTYLCLFNDAETEQTIKNHKIPPHGAKIVEL